MRLSDPDPDDNADIGTDDGPETYLLTDDEREQLEIERDGQQDAEDLDREARRRP
jgi:hypothetical protein